MSADNDWSSGYVSDVGYTYGYYAELNPLRTQLALLHKGLVPPNIENACELGFGQGLSVGIHAAASQVQWYGTDFNPSQAAFARELASVSGTDAKLADQAFEDFCNRSDLPDFDFIGLHGIWSWISDKNRTLIVDFVRRKLAVGGVLYVSYNTLPGWASFAPMRHLLTEHAAVLSAGGKSTISRIDEALAFMDKLLQTNPAYTQANPQTVARLNRLKTQNKHYLAHEYFNRDWHPMHFATMADWLQPTKLNYACSANYLDSVDGINLSKDQLALLREIPETIFAESVRDFVTNQQFRKDYWIKGARTTSRLERLERIMAQRVVLAVAPNQVSLKVAGSLGEGEMSENIYTPILDFLGDHKVRSIGELAEHVRKHNITHEQAAEAMMVLIGKGCAALAQDPALVSKCKKKSEKLNRHLMRKGRSTNDIQFLASPVTGGGWDIGRFQQLFVLAHLDGAREPAGWAKYAWETLKMQGEKLIKEDRVLETDEENLAELESRAISFKEIQFPIMRALEII